MKYAYRIEVKKIKEESFPYDATMQFHDPQTVVRFCSSLDESDKERMISIFLSAKNKLQGIDIQTGTIDRALVHPREILKAAIMSCAASVIFVHNHPSGDTTPSPEDKDLYSKLKAGLSLFQVNILDSIILGEGKYFSFKEAGILL